MTSAGGYPQHPKIFQVQNSYEKMKVLQSRQNYESAEIIRFWNYELR